MKGVMSAGVGDECEWDVRSGVGDVIAMMIVIHRGAL